MVRTTSDAPTQEAPAQLEVHPMLGRRLSELGLSTDIAPTVDQWQQLLAAADTDYRTRDLTADLASDQRGWSSFENLFRHTPVPIMEQDYTDLQLWMARLRAQGVTDIRTHLGGDIEKIRAVGPKIRMVAANPAAVRAVGIPHRDLIGPIDPIIINDGSVEGWVKQFEAVWNGTPVIHATIEAATASGELYDAETILAAPVVDGVPDFSRAVFTIFDVTDTRNEERRMIGLMEAKNRFLASVSHEVRTPLTAVLGFAQILDEQLDVLDHDDRRLMISAISQHAQEVANLIEDLLVAARVEIGQVEVTSIPVDLGKQLESVLSGAIVSIDVDIDFPLPVFAKGDPTRIRQIIRNLLSNAERYGGDHVRVVGCRSGNTAAIEVCDNGNGLPVVDWDRIFEPYHKAHRMKGQPESVGIGLAVSRQLAELMGGTLDYRYTGGVSVFRLTLPGA